MMRGAAQHFMLQWCAYCLGQQGLRQFLLLQLSHTCPVALCRRSCQERSAYPGNKAEHHAAYPASKQASDITRAAVLALNCLPLSRWCWRTAPAQLSCT